MSTPDYLALKSRKAWFSPVRDSVRFEFYVRDRPHNGQIKLFTLSKSAESWFSFPADEEIGKGFTGRKRKPTSSAAL